MNGATSPSDPLRLLRDLSVAFAQSPAEPPAQVEIAPVETLIVFQLAGARAAIDLAWLAEILPLVPLTRIPQIQPWMRGIANVRGKLLPVADGGQFLGRPQLPSKQQRILVIFSEEFSAGLIVDRVEGLRRFPHDAFVAPSDLADHPLRRYAAGGLEEPGRGVTPLFYPALLFQDPLFRDVTLRAPPNP